ncbi:tRNA (5-methylaminomethyl-2-thiouridine)(34)-methyltransferase MnmD [uncultured Roseobacter sp.]|uniref:tRNA (5-methylaminomethyl-2-thiouridine)(34)-methyltransferase MnmD n=1 Tax=uncultured Roseobacter sp. TaxID=114847 RepID=UPI00261F5A9F|nr:tRNA (5-methylaminomethyl-2-thiouridine)(34)-methyltransferase MnmD [uncultured Roseobacter sp.]
MSQQIAEITWSKDGVPVSDRYDDPYFSLQNGMEETRHVFLRGNQLPNRFRDGFHIAELGFGTGLNFLTTLLEWRNSGASGRFRFTSFEAFPLSGKDIAKALDLFPVLHESASDLCNVWNTAGGVFEVAGDVTLNVVVGDARDRLKNWGGRADAWFLDGFSPAKNPELWSESLLHQVANCTAEEGTFATYTAAGFVRRALSEAGFDVQRVEGFGRKRHMTVGRLKS